MHFRTRDVGPFEHQVIGLECKKDMPFRLSASKRLWDLPFGLATFTWIVDDALAVAVVQASRILELRLEPRTTQSFESLVEEATMKGSERPHDFSVTCLANWCCKGYLHAWHIECCGRCVCPRFFDATILPSLIHSRIQESWKSTKVTSRGNPSAAVAVFREAVISASSHWHFSRKINVTSSPGVWTFWWFGGTKHQSWSLLQLFCVTRPSFAKVTTCPRSP